MNNKGLLGKVVGFIIFIIVVAAILFVVPIPHTENYSVSESIPPLHEYNLYLNNIPSGSKVEINLQVSGGTGLIQLTINYPNGSSTSMEVLNSVSYSFVAHQGGNYTVVINNSIALVTKNVTGNIVVHEDSPLLNYQQIKENL
jgi:hypothetical protein